MAKPYDVDDLARGITWVLEDMDRHAKLSARARQKVAENFCIDRVTEQYLEIYRDVLGQQGEL